MANDSRGLSTTDSAPAYERASAAVRPARGASALALALPWQRAGRGEAPVVLIHELGGSLHSWDAVLPSLAPVCQVLRYDQRGQGDAEVPASPYALADQVDDLHVLILAQDFPRPAWLVGAAAGAAVAVAYALAYPDDVAGIVLCSPALQVDPSRRDYLLERGRMGCRYGMGSIVERTMDTSWPPVIRDDLAALARYRDRFVAQQAEGYALASRALADVDLIPDLPSLRCPCLALAGEHDLQRPPAVVAAQAAQIPQAVFEVVPRAGHLMAVQQPSAVAARLLAFLSGHVS